MIHPDVALRRVSDEIGYGVFAVRPIPRGTVTWVLDELDRVLTPAQVARMAPLYGGQLEKYTFRDTPDRLILCWDFARFMNHSCEPTCAGAAYGFELALRDIRAGEELTDDYAAFHLEPHEAFDCRCDARVCRGRIGPWDVAGVRAGWQAAMREALRALAAVEQPLWPLVDDASVRRACAQHGVDYISASRLRA